MPFVVILTGCIDHGHQDTAVVGPYATAVAADFIKERAIEQGVGAVVRNIHPVDSALSIVNTMSDRN